MTVDEFDKGYWYATELKDFAKKLGVTSTGKLRKDELEKAIRSFLIKGKLVAPTKRSLVRTGAKDVEAGLRLDLPILNYTSNKETKSFIEREALKIRPGLKRRSGARYRLNRWREEQLTKEKAITYADLVRKYIELNETKETFKKIPTGRYINFLSEFLANEKDATRETGIAAWHELKKLDVPKTYDAWRDVKAKKSA
jgi:hypothetical protein